MAQEENSKFLQTSAILRIELSNSKQMLFFWVPKTSLTSFQCCNTYLMCLHKFLLVNICAATSPWCIVLYKFNLVLWMHFSLSRYKFSFPFLRTNGIVTVDDNRVGPLYKHVFSPEIGSRLSFVGIPCNVRFNICIQNTFLLYGTKPGVESSKSWQVAKLKSLSLLFWHRLHYSPWWNYNPSGYRVFYPARWSYRLKRQCSLIPMNTTGRWRNEGSQNIVLTPLLLPGFVLFFLVAVALHIVALCPPIFSLHTVYIHEVMRASSFRASDVLTFSLFFLVIYTIPAVPIPGLSSKSSKSSTSWRKVKEYIQTTCFSVLQLRRRPNQGMGCR